MADKPTLYLSADDTAFLAEAIAIAAVKLTDGHGLKMGNIPWAADMLAITLEVVSKVVDYPVHMIQVADTNG